MRFLFLIVFWTYSQAIFAQGMETDISDTAHVFVSVTSDKDTSFSIKTLNGFQEWTVYYDKKHRQKAYHVVFGKPYTNETSETWYRNGQMKQKCVPVNIPCDLKLNIDEWYPDGTVKMTRRCYQDSCVTNNYYPSGKLKVKGIERPDSTHHNYLWHYDISYYENGQKKYDVVDPNGNYRQTIISYYETGEKMSSHVLLRSAQVGPYIAWYRNGQVMVEGQYTDPVLNELGIVLGNIKTGKWNYYDETGKLIREEWYEEGRLVKTLEH